MLFFEKKIKTNLQLIGAVSGLHMYKTCEDDEAIYKQLTSSKVIYNARTYGNMPAVGIPVSSAVDVLSVLVFKWLNRKQTRQGIVTLLNSVSPKHLASVLNLLQVNVNQFANQKISFQAIFKLSSSSVLQDKISSRQKQLNEIISADQKLEYNVETNTFYGSISVPEVLVQQKEEVVAPAQDILIPSAPTDTSQQSKPGSSALSGLADALSERFGSFEDEPEEFVTSASVEPDPQPYSDPAETNGQFDMLEKSESGDATNEFEFEDSDTSKVSEIDDDPFASIEAPQLSEDDDDPFASLSFEKYDFEGNGDADSMFDSLLSDTATTSSLDEVDVGFRVNEIDTNDKMADEDLFGAANASDPRESNQSDQFDFNENPDDGFGGISETEGELPGHGFELASDGDSELDILDSNSTHQVEVEVNASAIAPSADLLLNESTSSFEDLLEVESNAGTDTSVEESDLFSSTQDDIDTVEHEIEVEQNAGDGWDAFDSVPDSVAEMDENQTAESESFDVMPGPMVELDAEQNPETTPASIDALLGFSETGESAQSEKSHNDESCDEVLDELDDDANAEDSSTTELLGAAVIDELVEAVEPEDIIENTSQLGSLANRIPETTSQVDVSMDSFMRLKSRANQANLKLQPTREFDAVEELNIEELQSPKAASISLDVGASNNSTSPSQEITVELESDDRIALKIGDKQIKIDWSGK